VNSAAKGNAAERFVAKDLERRGFVVASRRHIGGAGDLLAVHPGGVVYLVEVKCRKHVYDGFRQPDREAMKQTPLPLHGKRFCANVKGSGKNKSIEWFAEADWP
jgi:Holliday junction resolvase-like predicted endonuclease